MHCSVTLTATEFKTVHNALCALDSVSARLDGVLDSGLAGDLEKAIDEIRQGLMGAYSQEDDDYETKRRHYDGVAAELGLECSAWAMYEVSDLNARHRFEGAQEVLYKNHWGRTPIRVPINGLTWAALWVAANACIRNSGDSHHIFIEHFTRSGDTLILSTGS